MKKGFTLIELLGVIVILGILVLVAFPPLLNQIKKSKNEINDATKALVIDAAKDYVEDNINNYEKTNGSTYCINISTLTENNYLNENLKNENLDNIDTSKQVKLMYKNNKFEYEITNNCTNNSLARNNIEVPIVTENSGLYKSTIDEGRYIYRGGDPINNWIELNEGTKETPNYIKYRIISFENDGTIKVVRNESIGNYAWDEAGNRNEETDTYCINASTNGCNIWGNQNNMLFKGEKIEGDISNYYYENSTTTELTKYGSGTITKDASLNTFLNPINSEQENKWSSSLNLDKYIQIHSFDVGGIYYINGYSGGDKGLEKEKNEEHLYTWNGKIGLPLITDFVESSLNETCTSVWSNGDKNTENTTNPCQTYNWLIKGNTLTLTNRPNSTVNLWYSNISCFKHSYTPKNTTATVRPAFYLKSSLSLIGEGTEEKSYRVIE